MHPLTLVKGKELFVKGAIPAAFTLKKSLIITSGVFIAYYKQAGKVRTNTIVVAI
jgi:hypothetical protein